MEPPSTELKHGLQSLKIANERDFQRCRARVRRLSQGLPAFDSVWIDGLVHIGVLTLFQARFFEQKRWSELQLTDSLILTDQLQFDPVMPMFSAVDMESRQPYMVTCCQVERAEFEAVAVRLKSLRQSSKNSSSLETFVLDQKKRFVAQLRPALKGESLEQLLVRRGRFPAAVVRAVAIGICDHLQHREPSTLHGDLRPANVWLSRMGQVELLNGGLLNLAAPTPTIHTKIPDDVYNGIAPERFDNRGGVSVSTEMYALGCLLWQLLAGRPPHALADPLARIAAHRQKSIRDIRELAPDVSAPLAELISKLTHRQPAKRPKQWGDVRVVLAEGVKEPRLRLKEFLRSFESAAPRNLGQIREKSSVPIVKVSLTLCFTLVAVLLFWNRDQLNLPSLSKVEATVQPIARDDFKPLRSFEKSDSEGAEFVNSAKADLNAESLPLLPAPDQNGVVLLESAGPYRATSLQAGESLLVRGRAGIRPTIRVEGAAATFDAKTVLLENVQLEFAGASKSEEYRPSVLQVVSDEFRLRRCVVQAADGSSNQPLLRWRGNSDDTMASGRLLVSNSILNSQRPVVEVISPLTTALFDNVLQRQSGSLLVLDGRVHSGLRVPVVLNSCTMAVPGPVIEINRLDRLSSSGVLSVQGTESLIKISPEVPLIGFTGEKLPEEWMNFVEVAAQGVIVPQTGRLFGFRVETDLPWNNLEGQAVRVDGLLSGEFHFTGSESASGDASLVPQVVIDHLPVRLSNQVPGFSFEQFAAALD